MRNVLKYTAALPLFLIAAPVFGQEPAAPQRPAAPQSAQPDSPGNTPELKQGVDQYLKSKSGQNGKQEPTASSEAAKKEDANDVFVNGTLNVPGAPKNSQTAPAKFSAENDAFDKLPIVEAGLLLSAEQKRKIAAALRTATPPVSNVNVKVSGELPVSVELAEIPDAVKSEFPIVNRYKFVRLNDRLLVVSPSNRIVVGEIAY